MPNFSNAQDRPWDSFLNDIKTVTIAPGVTTISPRAFRNCANLTAATIPNSVTKISMEAFYDCIKLSTIDLGSGVQTLERGAFINCTALTSITIPAGVTNIIDGTFYGCTNLKDVTILNPTPPTLHILVGPIFPAEGDTLHVPAGSLTAYQNDSNWRAAFTTITESN
ncbi:MAG: leucine-rich repeat domain-containing protein [Alistipes sp.]|nr:leucine-rich repeat domain-containing protein [Alistipes sp.]